MLSWRGELELTLRADVELMLASRGGRLSLKFQSVPWIDCLLREFSLYHQIDSQCWKWRSAHQFASTFTEIPRPLYAPTISRELAVK